MEKSTRIVFNEGKRIPQSTIAIASLGFAVYWAYLFLALFQKTTFIDISEITIASMRITFLAGLLASSFFVNLKADFFSTIVGHRVLSCTTVGFPLVVLCLSFTIMVGSVAVPPIVYIAVWFCIGVGLSALRMLWAELLPSYGQISSARILCLSVIIGAILFVVIDYLDSFMMVGATIALPYIGYGILRILEHEVTPLAFATREKSLELMPLYHTTHLFITLYGLIFGLAISYIEHTDFPLAVIGTGAALAIGAAVMIPYLEHNKGKMVHGKIQKYLMPALVLGLLPMPFVDGLLYALCALLLIACFAIFAITNLGTQIGSAAHYSSSPLYLVGKAGTPILIGIAAGYALGAISELYQLGNMMLYYYAPLGLVVLLTLCVTFIPLERDRFTEDAADETEPTSPTGYWKMKCDAVARDYKLSMREKEVFTLLAKGWGNDYIQDRLNISMHTVKTHTYNIYKKLEVRSRRELMTIVEDMVIDDDAVDNARKLA